MITLTFEDGSFPVRSVKASGSKVSFTIHNWFKGDTKFADLHKQLISRLDNDGGSELEIEGLLGEDLFSKEGYAVSGNHLTITLIKEE